MLGSHARAERTVLHRLSHLRFAHNNEELAEAILVEADWIRTKLPLWNSGLSPRTLTAALLLLMFTVMGKEGG